MAVGALSMEWTLGLAWMAGLSIVAGALVVYIPEHKPGRWVSSWPRESLWTGRSLLS